MDDAAAIRRLLDEAEIKRVLGTYPRGIDRGDESRISAIYHDDAIDFHGSGAGPGKAYGTRIVNGQHASPNEKTKNLGTAHTLGNIHIEFDGADVAHTETYVRAVNYREREGEWFVNTFYGRYLDRFERREGEWKIARRVTVRDFQGDVPITPTLRPRLYEGTRDETDPSYAHFRFEILPVELDEK